MRTLRWTVAWSFAAWLLVGAAQAQEPAVLTGESCEQNMDCCCPDADLERGATARASSTLKPRTRYAAANVLRRIGGDFAGDPSSAWCEGAKGPGKGEWIEIRFDTQKPLQALLLSAGYDKSWTTFVENGRVRSMALLLSDGARFRLEFGPHFQDLPRGGEGFEPLDSPTAQKNSPQLFVLPGEPRGISWFRLVLGDLQPGQKHPDTCISTIVPLPEVER
jgi:hypothetical protein